MQSNSKSLTNLQTALAMELSAVHQYLLHAHVVEDWGLDLLGKKMREEMQEELGHADTYMQRMMFLKGTPDVTPEKKPHRAETLHELFEADLADEREAITFYTKAAKEADESGDIGTRALFEKTALDEEGHMAWLELQLDLLKRMGEAAYLAMHVSAGREND